MCALSCSVLILDILSVIRDREGIHVYMLTQVEYIHIVVCNAYVYSTGMANIG